MDKELACGVLAWAVGQYQKAGAPWELRLWTRRLTADTADRCLFFVLTSAQGANPDDLA